MSGTVVVGIYLLSYCFSFYIFALLLLEDTGRVTRGNVLFLSVFSLFGPVSAVIGIVLSIPYIFEWLKSPSRTSQVRRIIHNWIKWLALDKAVWKK